MTAMRRGDRRAHAPLARHLRARDERDRGRHVEGRRDPREAEAGVPERLRRQPRPTSPFVARATVETLARLAVGERRAPRRPDRHASSYVNLGIAVALEDGKGLIVPVIQNAEELNLLGIARAIADLAERARDEEAAPGRRPGRHVHDHEPRRLRHVPRHADHQPAAGRRSSARTRVVKRPWVVAGRARQRRDRDPPDDEPQPHLRPPPGRRRLRRAVPARRCARSLESLGRRRLLAVQHGAYLHRSSALDAVRRGAGSCSARSPARSRRARSPTR